MRHHSKIETVYSALKMCGFPKPTPFQSQAFPALIKNRDIIAETRNSKGVTTAFILPLLQTQFPERDSPSVIILTSSTDSVEKITGKFRILKKADKFNLRIASLGSEGKAGNDLHLFRKRPSVIIGTTRRIIDHIRRNNIDFSNITKIVALVPENPLNIEFEQDMLFIASKLNKKTQFQIFINDIEHLGNMNKMLTHPQTLLYTNREKVDIITSGESSMDTQKLEAKIESIVQEIKANPDSLIEYRKVFKKKVPIFLRSYFAAKLLQDAEGSFPKTARRSVSGNMKTLFVSIGRRRRVHSGDLMKLFQKSLDIKSTEIGAIKVLDNYAFVDLNEKLCKTAVEKMNGMEYRGRKISVDFARKKN